jgi:hypothetical protein
MNFHSCIGLKFIGIFILELILNAYMNFHSCISLKFISAFSFLHWFEICSFELHRCIFIVALV